MLECLSENEEEVQDFTHEQYDDEEDQDKVDRLEVHDQNSDTEQEISDGEEKEEISAGPVFVGKDKSYKWSKHVPPSTKTRAENLITHLPGPKAVVKDLKDSYGIWQHFFSLDMIRMIVEWTNKHIERNKDKYTRDRNARETDIAEMEALIGLIHLAGVLKSGRLNTEELWTYVEPFRLTMSKFRFHFLLQHLRFHDIDTREERRKIDNLAPISDIFDLFVERCKSANTPFQYVTIDEKLEAFRGKCSFRVYIPNKPNKYGLKVFALVDAKTFYTCNLEVYVGTQPAGPYAVSNSASSVVERLVEPLRNSKRSITCDNWFTSIPLAQKLLSEYKLTFLGTTRKNKRELPLEFSNPTKRPLGSSMFAFTKDITLVSHIPKKNKNVLMLSTLHHDDRIDLESGKPDMIIDYNGTKGGVDTLDKMCAAYNCSRNTRR
nr:unnamed protein product [Callosobruchus analis]